MYEKFISVKDIFKINGVGIVTARDEFVTDRDKEALKSRIMNFIKSNLSDDDLHEFFRINKKKGWSIRKAHNELQKIKDSELENYVKPILYRPFDSRWVFYHDANN